MNCPNCKASIPDDSRSCPHCGQPVIHAREVIDAELVDAPQTREQQQYYEQSEGSQGGFYHRHVVFSSSSASTGRRCHSASAQAAASPSSTETPRKVVASLETG